MNDFWHEPWHELLEVFEGDSSLPGDIELVEQEMANTHRLKSEIEPWFRSRFVAARHPGREVRQEKVALDWGGNFEFDAVVLNEGTIEAVYLLSCSEYRTKTGKAGTGKLHKIKGDILMLLGAPTEERVLAFTGQSMFERVRKEQERGRIPRNVRLEWVELPHDLARIVRSVGEQSVTEVSPTAKLDGIDSEP